PTCPFRSAIPSESMRPVRVTRPAPTMTPMIPNRGRVETSEGIANAAACAISAVAGGRLVVVVLVMDSLMPRPNSSGNGETWAQYCCQVGIIEPNLDRNSLCHLGEIAGRVVWRQQRELRSARRSNLDDLAADRLA